MGEGGFVNQTYCDMMSWSWYTDVPVRCLFEHLLRVVNKSDNVISGLSIKKGSVLTTIPMLSCMTGLTNKQIRIAIAKLESSNDISINSFHKKGSIITIQNWDKYVFDNDYSQNQNKSLNYHETDSRADKGQIQTPYNNTVTTQEDVNRADKGQINQENTKNNPVRADKGQIQIHDVKQDTITDGKNGADKGQINEPPKEVENRENSPTPLKENKEEENTNSKEINNNINIIKKEKFFEDEPEKKADEKPEEKTEKKTEEKTDEGQKTDDNATPKKKPVYTISFSFEKSVFEGIIDKDIELWKKAYPAIDVENEILKAACWLAANPKNAKSNYKKFLNNWFSRAQDHAHPGQQLLKFPSQMSYGERKRLQAGPDVAQVPGFLGKEIDFDKDDPSNPF